MTSACRCFWNPVRIKTNAPDSIFGNPVQKYCYLLEYIGYSPGTPRFLIVFEQFPVCHFR